MLNTRGIFGEGAAPLRAALDPSTLLPSVTAGIIGGLLGAMWGIAEAALIFGGSLESHLAQGIALGILSAVILNIAAAIGSCLPSVISNAQEMLAVIIGVGVAPMAGSLAASHPSRVLPTVVAVIAVSSFLTGAVFFVLGVFRLGRLVRYVPFPVIGGFLAGTGWLIVLGGVQVLSDVNPTLGNVGKLMTFGQEEHLMAGALVAAVLLVVVGRITHPLLMPGLIVVCSTIFFGAIALTGQSLSTAEANGWVIGPFTHSPAYPPMGASGLGQIDWPSVAGQAPTIATVVIVAAIGLLLNFTGLEVEAGDYLDVDAELTSTGIANLICGLTAALPGFFSFSSTLVARRVGNTTRAVGVVAAMVALLVLVAGTSILAYIPRFILGGFVLYLGVDLLLEWVGRGWFKMTHTDFGMVVIILIVIGVWGFLAGLLAGLILGILTFVVSYSRTGAVRQEVSGARYHSSVDRSPAQRDYLEEHGDAIDILALHGFLFFGTTTGVLDAIRRRLEDQTRTPPQFIVLDCRLVTGADASISSATAKLQTLVRRHGARVLIAGLHGSARNAILRGVTTAMWSEFLEFPDLDQAVEWCEQQILRESTLAGVHEQPLLSQLTVYLNSAEQAAVLMCYLERLVLPEGSVLMEQGADPENMYLVESGELKVMLRATSGADVRLRTVTAGALVGEIGFYLGVPRTASVLTTSPSVLYRLTRESLEQMRQRDPALAVAFTEVMVRLLARRVQETNEAISVLFR